YVSCAGNMARSDRILDLILQHLTATGLRATRKVLQEEARVECMHGFSVSLRCRVAHVYWHSDVHRDLDGSRLSVLLLRAVQNAERVFDLTMTPSAVAATASATAGSTTTTPSSGTGQPDIEGQLVEELLALGLESADDLDMAPDVSIWDTE